MEEQAAIKKVCQIVGSDRVNPEDLFFAVVDNLGVILEEKIPDLNFSSQTSSVRPLLLYHNFEPVESCESHLRIIGAKPLTLSLSGVLQPHRLNKIYHGLELSEVCLELENLSGLYQRIEIESQISHSHSLIENSCDPEYLILGDLLDETVKLDQERVFSDLLDIYGCTWE